MYSMRLPDPGSSCIGCTFGYHSGFFSLVEAGSQDGYSPKDLNAQQTLECTLGYFGDSTFQPLQVCREKSPESFPRHWPGHKLQVGPHTVGVTSSRDGEARLGREEDLGRGVRESDGCRTGFWNSPDPWGLWRNRKPLANATAYTKVPGRLLPPSDGLRDCRAGLLAR